MYKALVSIPQHEHTHTQGVRMRIYIYTIYVISMYVCTRERSPERISEEDARKPPRGMLDCPSERNLGMFTKEGDIREESGEQL